MKLPLSALRVGELFIRNGKVYKRSTFSRGEEIAVHPRTFIQLKKHEIVELVEEREKDF